MRSRARYKVTYRASQQSGRQLVASVQECGSDNVCLTPTAFNWTEETWNTTGKRFAATDLPAVALPFSLPISQQSIVWAADWNGDGRSDLIGWQRTDLGNNTYRSNCAVRDDVPPRSISIAGLPSSRKRYWEGWSSCRWAA